jgi:hypothetical protein
LPALEQNLDKLPRFFLALLSYDGCFVFPIVFTLPLFCFVRKNIESAEKQEETSTMEGENVKQ